MRRRKSPELSLPQRLLHRLLAARTGHGDFAAYHRRLKHVDANLECVCGRETTPTHFISCRRYANQMRKFRHGMNMNTFRKYLLGHDCFKNFKKFIQITGCFDSQISDSSSARREESNWLYARKIDGGLDLGVRNARLILILFLSLYLLFFLFYFFPFLLRFSY